MISELEQDELEKLKNIKRESGMTTKLNFTILLGVYIGRYMFK